MPIVNTTQDQQTHDTTNPTIMITPTDRNLQTECSLILPSTTNSPVTIEDSLKSIPKKEDVPVTTEDVAISQPETTGIIQFFKQI